jgi:hypothetical protein
MLVQANDARATSAEDASFHTAITVDQILSIEASVLLHSCSCALCLCDIIGNRLKFNTLVYGPNGTYIQVLVDMVRL